MDEGAHPRGPSCRLGDTDANHPVRSSAPRAHAKDRPMTPTAPQTAPDRVREAVLAMPVARSLGLRFRRCEPGAVELELPFSDALSFRPGQLQATAIFAAADF